MGHPGSVKGSLVEIVEDFGLIRIGVEGAVGFASGRLDPATLRLPFPQMA